jgi:hypothetical protein
MKRAFAKFTGLVWTRFLSTLVALSALPLLWAVAYYPIDTQSVYVGPITLFTGISLSLWILTSIAALAAAIWIHLNNPSAKPLAWYALSAGECGFASLFLVSGTWISIGLEGHLTPTWGDLLFAASLVGFAVSLRRALVTKRPPR